ncbi:hypothetical protein CRUP_032037, partial [Coryphaenoides rupestris]
MDDTYPYELLAELGESDVPRLRNKLLKHFQSKKRADGGECRIQYEDGGRTATLHFRRKEDMARVLAKESHEVVLEKGLLKVTVRLPGGPEFSLEILSDICSAVVTFSSGKENNEFITSCQTNRMFLKKNLSVRPLEATTKVKVEDVSNINTDFLLLYFENEGWEVEQVTPDEEEQSAIISFKMPAAVQETIKKKHIINKKHVNVFPFYDSLKMALYGKDQPNEDGGRTATLHFRRKEDRARVLAKESHEVVLEKGLLKVTARLPGGPEFSLEILSDMCSAVVTFSSGKENNEFITSCQTNRIFLKKNLSVRPLEATTKVKVEDVSNINTDFLLLYFENEGWEVEQVTPDEEEQSAIISFKMPAAVQEIIKKKHIINKKHVNVFPFYDSLEMALYGKDQPTLKLPAPFSETIDPTMLMYLHKKQEAAETVCSDLSARFCKVDLLPSSVSFSPLPTLLQQKDIKAKDIKEWKHSVEQAFKQALSKFKTLRLQPPLSAWEASEVQIGEMVLNKAVEVIPDKAGGALSVIGFVEEVTRLEPALNELLSGIEKRVIRENTNTEHKFEISKVMYQLLCQDGLADQLKSKYPEMKIAFQDKMTINGLPNEIYDAANMVIQKLFTVKKQTLVLDNTLSQFLKDEDEGNLTNVLTSNGIHAAVERVGTALNILAVSDIILKNAEDQLKQVLISQCIDVDDCNILKTVQWQNLIKSLEESTNTASKKIVITTTKAHQLERVTVVGYKDSVIPIFTEIQEHLHKYSKVNETLPVQHDVILRYIEAHSNSLSGEVMDNVDISYGKESVIFRGPREDVEKCKHKFDTLISSVCFKEHKLAKSGAKEFFQLNEAMYGSILMKDTGCIVQLVDESAIGQNDVAPKFGNQGSSYSQHRGLDQQTTKPLGTNTQAVVNVVGKDLDMEKGAVSKAILGAAGPYLQVLLTENGKTGNFGDVIITKGCSLKSNVVFHAVVPPWDNQGYAHKIMTGIVQDCLNEAERRGLTSITFPAIGTGNLGFPKDIAASVMIEEFLKFKKQSMSLKTVIIVVYPKDRETVQVFKDELKKRLISKVTTTSGKHEMTIRHVKVEVVLGDITKETTDVIVNSSNASFNLKSGAQPNTGMIMTVPGNLKCQRILHLVGHSDPQEIQQAMHDALVLVEQNAYTSISFPALGTGQGNAQADQVADAMLDAVVDMVAQSAQSCLKVVRIIIFQPAMMKAIMWITDLINKEQRKQTIKKKPSLDLSKANIQDINDIQKTMNVIVKIEDDNADIQGHTYKVNLQNGSAMDNRDNILQIRRYDKQKDDVDAVQLPSNWEPIPSGSQCHVVPIQQQTPEYNEVLQLFSSTCKKTVIKIERIQSASMWKGLQIKKQDMESRNGHQNNEKRLFHGACHTTIKTINEYGFNRSYAGKNATCFGKGCYFAANASYSAIDTYSKPDAQGQKYM